MKAGLRSLVNARAWLADQFWNSETALMMTNALLVGGLAGLGTVAFRKSIDGATTILFASAQNIFGALFVLILPILGGLAVGIWMRALKSHGVGQGVAGIMEAAAYHGGRIDVRGAIARVVGAVITIGSGGSAGPEDPSVQIGATIGSQVGQVFRLSEARIRTLVGCGAAAGIAAAFNAPISGVFFAIEIILGEFSGIAVSFIVIAAVAGAAVSQIFLGAQPAFVIPIYQWRSPIELIFYFILGFIAAIAGVVYVWLLSRAENFFERWQIVDWFKPMIGGAVVGIIALLLSRDVMGTGYPSIEKALTHPGNDALFFFALVALKIIATSSTLGSGGQGGLFAPSLFLGGMLGSGFGIVMNALFPTIAAPPPAYAMVAMGAVLASAVRAPMVALLLPFEVTNDYHIILPLMIAVVTGFVVARHIEPESVYTIKLKARGVDVTARRDLNIMRALTVGEAMLRDFQPVLPMLSVTALGELFHETNLHGFPVLNEHGKLIGIVTLSDYERAVVAGKMEAPVAEICTRNPITAFPDESLEDVLKRFGANEIGRVPVVDRRDPQRLLGMLRAADIAHAYSRVLVQRIELQERMARMRAGGANVTFVEIEIPRGSVADGALLRELELPADCVLVSIKRRGDILIPRGDTLLLAADRVTAFVADASRVELTRRLTGTKSK